MAIDPTDEARHSKKQLSARTISANTKDYLTLHVTLCPDYWLVAKPLKECDYSFVVAINRSSELEVLAVELGKSIRCKNMDVYNF